MKNPLWFVLLIVAALLAASVDHGLPHRYVPDDSAVKCALGIARDLGGAAEVADPSDSGAAPTFVARAVHRLPDRARQAVHALVPPAGRYTNYPYLLPYLDLGAIGVRFAVGRARGEWTGTGQFAEAVFDDPTVAWLPARWVSVLLALLLPLATARIARELERTRGEAAAAALLAGTSLLCVQYAHTARPWAALVALGAVTLAASMRLRRRRTTVAVCLAFLAGALTASTHQVGLVALGLPLLGACLWRVGFKRTLVGALFAALTTAVIGYPFVLLHGLQTGAGTIVEGAAGAAGALQIGGQAFDAGAFSGKLLRPVLHSWVGYDPLLVVLGPLGWLYLMRPAMAWRWVLLAVPAMSYSLVFLFYDGTHVRYLMPAVPALAVGAAATLGVLGRVGSRVIVVVLLALPLVQAGRFDWLLAQEDTRTLAARRLSEVVDAEQVVAIDAFGSFYGPPVALRGDHALRWAAVVPPTRSEQRVMDRVTAGEPELPGALRVVPVSRFYRFDSYYPTDYLLTPEPMTIEAFMDAWNVDVYVQVDRIPDARRRRPLTELTAGRGELLLELSPTGTPGPGRAELPTDLNFPLRELWEYQRPGPLVRVWRLLPPPPADDTPGESPTGSDDAAQTAPVAEPSGSEPPGDQPGGEPPDEQSGDEPPGGTPAGEDGW